jgi:hypothetical protein
MILFYVFFFIMYSLVMCVMLVVELDYVPNSYAGQRNCRIHNSSEIFVFCNSNIVIM